MNRLQKDIKVTTLSSTTVWLMKAESQENKDFALFFPRMQLTETDGKVTGLQDSDTYELLSEKAKMLPFLQTLFFEERLIEIQVDRGTRIFFGALWDHRPELEEYKEDEDDEPVLIEPDYQDGAYLKELDHLVLSPLEPVAGNMKVRSSNTTLLCFYAGTNAVELGTRFIKAENVRGAQVLLFEYPTVGRIIRGNRPFRAKLPQDIELIANICDCSQHSRCIDCSVMDISSQGLSLEHEEIMNTFSMGDMVRLTILSPICEPLEINGTIRHFAKIRTKQGNSTICGVQLDLESRSLAELVEQLFAKIQRVFIRNLTERTEDQDIHLAL